MNTQPKVSASAKEENNSLKNGTSNIKIINARNKPGFHILTSDVKSLSFQIKRYKLAD